MDGFSIKAFNRMANTIVILDRCADLPREMTSYCIHGQATCCNCGQWCWLGDKSATVCASGKATPMCQPCAASLVIPGSRPVSRLSDHRRSEGTH